MPSLYFTPTSCGAASFIASKRGGIKWDRAEIVDLQTHTLVSTKEDYYKINPKGNVPTIQLDDKSLLNENVGTLYWIGKNSRKNNLLGNTTADEYQVVNLLGYLASEIHSSVLSPLFYKPSDEVRQQLVKKFQDKLAYIKKAYLSNNRKFLVGSDFTVADSYLYIMLGWPDYLKIDLPEEIKKYREGIAALDFVKDAHAEMAKIQGN